MYDKSGIIIYSGNKITSIEINGADGLKSISKHTLKHYDDDFEDVYNTLIEPYSPRKRRRKVTYRIKREKSTDVKPKENNAFGGLDYRNISPIHFYYPDSSCCCLNTYDSLMRMNANVILHFGEKETLEANRLNTTQLGMAFRLQQTQMNSALINLLIMNEIKPTIVPSFTMQGQACPFCQG